MAKTKAATAAQHPSYGELIDLLEQAEQESRDFARTLCDKVHQMYPDLTINRPARFYDTVKRIAAPTRASLKGPSKLQGSPLLSYRKRQWIPKNHNPPGSVDFPFSLGKYGLTETLLAELLTHVQSHKESSIPWQLKGVPEIEFYQELHHFIRKWPPASSASKATIGRLYTLIDRNLQDKGYSPSYAYTFIERTISTNQCSHTTMIYGTNNTAEVEIKAAKKHIQNCTMTIEKLTTDYNDMKKQFEQAKQELMDTRSTLKDVTNQMKHMQIKCSTVVQQATQLHADYSSVLEDNLRLIQEIERNQDKNSELFEALFLIRQELSKIHNSTTSVTNSISDTRCIRTKYSPAVRKLYYSLLADQITPAKIGPVIKTILKSFFPDLNVEQLQLPKERCAGSMRLDELPTISMAHKATVLCKSAQEGKSLHMNTDGTTLKQKKLGSIAVNNTVISVNELPDGTAESIINDVSKELQKLRETAHALNLPNANQLNWTLFSSSTSDCASTQKKVNKLIEQKKEQDRERFGQECSGPIEFVKNFCAMHLGCNLRSAFLNGIKNDQDKGVQREYHSVDTLVHEFCKLFGHCGVPEYACGVLAFPDFLKLMLSDETTNSDSRSYYLSCIDVKLDRQVGSRYFVTAANAGKILFLKEAALHFLKFTGKDDDGNKLEKEVNRKLQQHSELAQLKIDALMFFHVYADLVMLSKSKKLNKSAMDMNQHYLELQMFLGELIKYPEAIMDQSYCVFKSEPLLYGDDKELNHRLHSKSKAVHQHLFMPNELDDSHLYPLVVAGATTMKVKLCQYASNQLPGGIYWDPDPTVKAALEQLSPSNDICESILGLNDYLTTAIPNMDQSAQSTLIQVKKNKTIGWLDQLPHDQQERVLDLAVTYKTDATRKRRKEHEDTSKQRRQHMLHAHERKEALKARAQKEKDKLSNLHLITSSGELYKALEDIENETSSSTKKKSKTLCLLRDQINIRKKVLKQDIRIPFSHAKKQRPVNQIAEELSDFIAALPRNIKDPEDLVGKRIAHRFKLAETHEERWYDGTIVSYDALKRLHEVNYDGEEEQCYFDLEQDFMFGDIRVL